MILNFFNIIFILILFAHLFVLSICVYNYFTAPRLSSNNLIGNDELPLSILIPARNEERNIKNCLDTVFNSNYRNYEVIVLDDVSKDKTLEILRRLSIRLIIN